MSPLLKLLIALVVTLSSWTTTLIAAESPVSWDELSPLIAGKRVWLPLNDGTSVTGTVHSVSPTALQIEIEKSSDRKTHPKGAATIPASLVSTISMNKLPGNRGKLIGGIIGGAISVIGAGILAGERSKEGGTAGDGIIATLAVAPAAIGLTLGWWSDRIQAHESVAYRIVPATGAERK